MCVEKNRIKHFVKTLPPTLPTMQQSDITGGNPADYMQFPPESQKFFFTTFFHTCSVAVCPRVCSAETLSYA